MTSFCICRCFPFGPPPGGMKVPRLKVFLSFFIFFVLFSDMGTSRWKFLAIGYPKAVSSVSQMIFQSVVYIRLYVSKLYYFSLSLYLSFLCLTTLCLGSFIQKTEITHKIKREKSVRVAVKRINPSSNWGSR